LRAGALAVLSSMLVLAVPAQAQAQKGDPSAVAAVTGGSAYVSGKAVKRPMVAGRRAKLLRNGIAAAPAAAPPAVQRAVWAGNKLQDKPYRYGGGHASFKDTGYDCSGTVSFALKAAGVLSSPLDSSSFMRWGASGKGRWITVYTNPGHAYVVIAGLRLDTSAAGDARNAGRGPRWRGAGRAMSGFVARHAPGL
jgi:hypothetical protein